MSLADALPRLLWAVSVGLLFIMGFLLIVPRHVDASAKQRSEEFCNSVQIGEPVQSFLAKTKNLEEPLVSWEPKDGKTHYQAWFRGFFANAFTCELYAQEGEVVSRFTEEHTW